MHLLAIPFLLIGITSKIKHRKLVQQMDDRLSVSESLNISNLIDQGNEAKVSGEILYAQRKGQD